MLPLLLLHPDNVVDDDNNDDDDDDEDEDGNEKETRRGEREHTAVWVLSVREEIQQIHLYKYCEWDNWLPNCHTILCISYDYDGNCKYKYKYKYEYNYNSNDEYKESCRDDWIWLGLDYATDADANGRVNEIERLLQQRL